MVVHANSTCSHRQSNEPSRVALRSSPLPQVASTPPRATALPPAALSQHQIRGRPLCRVVPCRAVPYPRRGKKPPPVTLSSSLVRRRFGENGRSMAAKERIAVRKKWCFLFDRFRRCGDAARLCVLKEEELASPPPRAGRASFFGWRNVPMTPVSSSTLRLARRRVPSCLSPGTSRRQSRVLSTLLLLLRPTPKGGRGPPTYALLGQLASLLVLCSAYGDGSCSRCLVPWSSLGVPE